MSVRNCGEIGLSLQKIVNRLMANDNLVKLLYYTDKDPLAHAALTDEEKKKLVFDKLIKVVPRIGPKEDASSLISVRAISGQTIHGNREFRTVKIAVEIFVPLTQWYIKDSNLRPFAIMGEIENSLSNKTINGLGKIQGGDFDLNFLTEEISAYEQVFWITEYD